MSLETKSYRLCNSSILKKLLTFTAILEGATGLGLVIVPGFVVSLLLGTALNEPAGTFVSRLAGVALMTLAIICWLYRNIGPGVQGIRTGLMFYNTAAGLILIIAYVNGYLGYALWPALLLHMALAIWCIKFPRKVN